MNFFSASRVTAQEKHVDWEMDGRRECNSSVRPLLRRYAASTELIGILNLALKRQARGLHAYGVIKDHLLN
jgi:hypothetical protein